MSNLKKIAIIGAGPAGVLCAIFLAQTKLFDVTLFDQKFPLTTLLPTGGGRCNLTYFEEDNREFVKFYPRGEKFLLSIFSRFNALNTIEMFESIGIETFVQEDKRVFPKSESSRAVSEVLNSLLKKYSVKIVRENVDELLSEDDMFLVSTPTRKHQYFHKCVISTGGKGSGFLLAQSFGHKIEPLKAALSPLKLFDDRYYSLAGLALKDVGIRAFFNNKLVAETNGDMLFTHKAISGPGVYKISSLCANVEFSKSSPLKLKLDISKLNEAELDVFLKNTLLEHPKKILKNIFSDLIPKRLLELIFQINDIDLDKLIVHLSKKERALILKNITALELDVVEKAKGEEIVTAGGICLDEINPKNMESKLQKNLFFCGEVINVDGFTGGFNLQNCWSTAFVCAEGIKSQI